MLGSPDLLGCLPEDCGDASITTVPSILGTDIQIDDIPLRKLVVRELPDTQGTLCPAMKVNEVCRPPILDYGGIDYLGELVLRHSRPCLGDGSIHALRGDLRRTLQPCHLLGGLDHPDLLEDLLSKAPSGGGCLTP